MNECDEKYLLKIKIKKWITCCFFGLTTTQSFCKVCVTDAVGTNKKNVIMWQTKMVWNKQNNQPKISKNQKY